MPSSWMLDRYVLQIGNRTKVAIHNQKLRRSEWEENASRKLSLNIVNGSMESKNRLTGDGTTPRSELVEILI